VIFAKDREPVSLFPMAMFTMDHLESTRRGDTMWLPPENIRVSRDSRAIAETLDELGLAKEPSGSSAWSSVLRGTPRESSPTGLWNAVLARFPNARFTPVAAAFSRLIMTLSQEEIAVVRHAASIGDDMVRAMVATACHGVSESEVYAAAMATAYRRGTVVPGMRFWSGPAPVASGPPQWSYRPQASREVFVGALLLLGPGQPGHRPTCSVAVRF
jgi:Xaa-Pro aminopeptidase